MDFIRILKNRYISTFVIILGFILITYAIRYLSIYIFKLSATYGIIIFDGLLLSYPLLIITIFYKRRFRDFYGILIFKPSIKYLFYGLIYGCVGFILAIISKGHYHQRFIDDINPAYRIFSIMIGAPVIEEMFFRGFILSLLTNNRTGINNTVKKPIILNAAIIISALLFTIGHFNEFHNISIIDILSVGIYTFILAVFLGIIRLRYNSVIPSIFMHAGANIGNYIGGFIYIFILKYFFHL